MKSTHELLRLPTVSDFDDGLPILGDYFEGEVLDVRLDCGIIILAADKALGIEYGVVGVHRDLVLCSISDETPRVVESNIGGSCSVSLVVGNDFWRMSSVSAAQIDKERGRTNMVVLPYADTGISSAKIDTDGLWHAELLLLERRTRM
jgi:hypothetical protein